MDTKSLSSRVQLFIKCQDLRDVEVFSKSDPFVEVFEKKNDHLSYIEKTEVMWDNLNPKFMKSIEIEYYFESEMFLVFKIFDANQVEGREVKGDFLGECDYSLSQIIGAKGNWLRKGLYNEKKRPTKGHIFLRATEIDEGNFDVVSITFSGNSLVYKGVCCFQVFKPQFNLYIVMERDSNQIVYSSEVLRGNNPKWKQVQKSVRELTAGNMNRMLLFELNDAKRSGKLKQIGYFQFTLNEVKEKQIRAYRLVNDYREDLGEVRLESISFHKEPSFLDYVYGGCSISLIIGIDFTSSNGHPSGPSSLHYVGSKTLNQYQQALQSVGQILLSYDSDKLVPLYGFGAQVNNVLSHCFPLNFNESNPSVFGLEGIMESYKTALNQIKLAGPTNFSPIINIAVDMAEAANVSQENQQYFILLIMTDGLISDMKETIDVIVRGTQFPLSIIIVGVGNAEFLNMDILDGDDEMLKDSKGTYGLRDIVQFVPYNNYKNSPSELTKEVLSEIPREIINFFKMKGIKPGVRTDELEVIDWAENEIQLKDIRPIIK